MSVVLRRLRPVLSAGACLVAAAAVLAAEETKQEKSEPEKPAAVVPVDRFAVPDGDVLKLFKFIEDLQADLQAFQPNSRDEFIEYRDKTFAAMKKASEKIMQLEPDKKSDAFQKAKALLLQLRVQSLLQLQPQQQKELLEDVKSYLTEKAKLTRDELVLAFSAARMLEGVGNRDLALRAYKEFGKRFSESGDEQLKTYGEKMLGSARRMNLLGNPVHVEGKTVDGKPFDWKAYRGKVVLVDFWATWCGPCVAELPNVKKEYELYHGKGFDVVGISLDNKREDLEKFIQDQSLPWACLFQDDGGWNHPMANYYGVMAIPCVILVDQQGKAVNLNARGEVLVQELERLLGPVEPKVKSGEKKAEPQTETKPTGQNKP